MNHPQAAVLRAASAGSGAEVRYVQHFEQGLGSHLLLVQLGRVVLNRCQYGISLAGIADPEGLNDKHHATSRCFLAYGSAGEAPYISLEPHNALLKEQKMRIMIASALFAMLMATHAVEAQGKVESEVGNPKVAASKSYSAEESAAAARAARAKAEAQERIWDRKMKTIAKGICIGC